jgi:hypothetical protein
MCTAIQTNAQKIAKVQLASFIKYRMLAISLLNVHKAVQASLPPYFTFRNVLESPMQLIK